MVFVATLEDSIYNSCYFRLIGQDFVFLLLGCLEEQKTKAPPQEVSKALSSWWFATHLKNMLVNLDHLPNFRGEHKKIFETITQLCLKMSAKMFAQKI